MKVEVERMLKQFIACVSPKDRFEFFDHTKITDWSEEEYEAVADILGIKFQANEDSAQKYVKIHYTLEQKVK